VGALAAPERTDASLPSASPACLACGVWVDDDTNVDTNGGSLVR